LVALLISIIFSAQFLYYSYGQSFLQVSALKYIGQTASVAGTVTSLLSPNLVLFFLNFFVVLAVAFFTFKKQKPQFQLRRYEKAGLFLLMVLVACAGYYVLVKQEDKEWGNSSRLYSDVYDLNTLVEKMGIVNFSFEDAFKYISRANLVTAADRDVAEDWAEQKNTTQSSGPQKYAGIDKGKNIIFIQVESLENCDLNEWVNGQEVTPNLDALAKSGVYFNNYYTQIGPGNTADAEFSTLNSLYPLQDDVIFVDYAQNTYNALPSWLEKQGYGTYSLHGDVPTFWNRSNIYPNLGYKVQFSESDYVKSRSIGKGPSDLGDEDFFLQSLQKMQSFKQPFFSTLITISSHTPFELPQDLQTLDLSNQDNLNYTQQQYLESIHYADKAIGEFIEGFQKTPIYNNSVIFIYGDHGSFTNICGALGRDTVLPGLSNSQVPLVVLNSGVPAGPDTIAASHIDLYPTITNLLGIKPPTEILGQDVFNTKTPVVTHRNLFSGNINAILTDTMAFESNNNGVFEDSSCLSMPGKTPVPIDQCKQLYDQQSDNVHISDTLIRGNLIKKQ